MELRMAPASPPTPPPAKELRLDSAAASPYATAPSSPRGRLVRDEGAAGGTFLTAPPSPNQFDLLPPATPRLTGANPFDLFQHFTSAPASPRRAAAIYAHFAEGNGGVGRRDGDGEEDSDGDEEFQPRGSYATGGSSVPFDWEERPGTPKRGLGAGAANEAAWDTDFEFGTIADKAAPAETLTTADELFEEGKIRPLKPRLKTADEPKVRPLKPPPGLLDGGSVASSPRSPMARGGMRSPRRRSRVGSGFDFDPFAAALLEATKAPSPLGGKEDNGGGCGPGSPPKKLATRPASRSAGWRRWRLSDLLLFRSSSDGAGGRANKQDPIFKPAQQFDAPVKKAFAQPAVTIKASGKGDDVGKAKKHGNRSAAAAAESVAGCARLSPLQRLAKGLGAYSWHYGRDMAAPATKG
ncbi:uncharacterized protein LOC120671390 [Panicum virgatum]|uniref:Uncharacterized protein n=1 Tax=Panicum virgatum TaxID=38727 RepID=A0A8T0T388_PANVG|nr:uncharacterized protein LOC120671390 [Panicum virgatum]KAG2605520.1 hypothetical protein PVAP13_4NG089200 [Panicum virgatum]